MLRVVTCHSQARHDRRLWCVVLALAGTACIEQPPADVVSDTGTADSAQVTALIDSSPLISRDSVLASPDRTRAESPPGEYMEVHATSEELAELQRQLIIPVAGVQPSELRDTYTESRGSRPHDAIDIPAPRGTPVVSAAAGRLMRLHNSVPGGLMVYAADESDRFILMYGHLDAYAPGVADNMPLRQGQVIGYVGTTGNAPPNTPHLHFAIARGKPSVSWSRGTPVNPYPLLVRSRPAPSTPQ